MTPTEMALAWGVGMLLVLLGLTCWVLATMRYDEDRRSLPLALVGVVLLATAVGWAAYWTATDDASSTPVQEEHSPSSPPLEDPR